MSKMLEAWKKFCDTETAGPTGNFEFDLFSAGYQAAIAAIREGGPFTYAYRYPKGITMRSRNEYPIDTIYLYRLPDDLT